MSNIHINIHDKTYKVGHLQQPAIRDLQLEIRHNEFVCLIGPSGCGKTTLLNIIAGLDSDYQGDINIGMVSQQPHIGYVFQNPRLLPWYTLRKNIELVFPKAPPTQLIDSLLATMQLSEVQQVYPERLSLGMQRRGAIIRAFAINPDLLLMDEPFVSLDAPTARQIRNHLYSLWLERPHTVLFVSHDLREAIALADRLVFLSPAPMRITASVTVSIDRNQRNDVAAIEGFHQRLLKEHPQLDQFL